MGHSEKSALKRLWAPLTAAKDAYFDFKENHPKITAGLELMA